MLYLLCSVALWHQSVTQLTGVRDRRCRHSFQNITAPSYCHQIAFFSDIFSLKYVSDFLGSASWTGHPKLLCCSAADQLQRQMCSHCFRATDAQIFFFYRCPEIARPEFSPEGSRWAIHPCPAAPSSVPQLPLCCKLTVCKILVVCFAGRLLFGCIHPRESQGTLGSWQGVRVRSP